MSKIIKGYWKCKYCNTEDIDGLIDICPNCGRQKSEDVKYYMKGANIEVSDKELEKAGIKREECDGNHKDWICNYCNQLNNFSDLTCQACGAHKNESTHEYGQIYKEIQKTNNKIEEIEDLINKTDNNSQQDDFYYYSVPEKETYKSESIFKKISCYIPQFIITGFLVFLAMWGFWPLKEEVRVESFSWERNITIEEEKTVQESGWSVPSGGRVYAEKEEFKEYIQVLDHYETVVETKSRQVIDYYDTIYTYSDNGNGTFTQHSHKTPVYKTEYYTETHQKPVYREEAVYATKYYYEIERWYDAENSYSSGKDQKPYWNTNYILKENERDINRTEKYTVYYDNKDYENLSYDKWINMTVGDGFILTKCRLGIIYSKKAIN